MTAYIRWFRDIRLADIGLVGGKTASRVSSTASSTPLPSASLTALPSPPPPTGRCWTGTASDDG